MDRKRSEDRRRIGSVKDAVNIYGDKVFYGNSSFLREDFPEEPSSRVKAVHKTRRAMSKRTAESELFSSKETVNELSSMIEESNLERSRKNGHFENKALVFNKSTESYRYKEVMRELDLVKQELSQLKLDMASVIEEKAKANKEFEVSSSRTRSNAASAEALKEQIEAATEEHVLVELAQIEALKEVREIEARREKEADEFSFKTEETKKKMNEMIEEIDVSKELEAKLGVTLSDVTLLQDELKQVKGPDTDSFASAENVEATVSLESIKIELEAARKELNSIKDEDFQYMSSMDVIRNELKHVKDETLRLKKTEEKADLKVQRLNSKLARAKSKLEALVAAEEKAISIAKSLSLTLEQISAEAEVSKKEKMLVTDNIATINVEIQKTESEIDLTEERLQAAMEDLEAVKSSEALGLEKLRSLIETTMQSRASASNHSPTISISRFEYEYLTGHAVGAEEIADKKVAAAQAWIEALKANETEILMKIEIANRELRELRIEEEHEVPLSAKKIVASQNRQSLSIRSMKNNGNLTPSQRVRLRKSTSASMPEGGPTAFIITKKR